MAAMTVSEWFTLGTLIVSGLAATYAILGYYLARGTRIDALRAQLPKLVLKITQTPTEGGWHLAELMLMEAREAKYWIVSLEVRRPRRALICPIREETFKLRDYSGLAPLSERASARQEVLSWRWRALDEMKPDLASMLFFISGQNSASRIVSLRVMVEEISPSRTRSHIQVNSNPIDWRPTAPASTARSA
jgi:hypothetical protein